MFRWLPSRPNSAPSPVFGLSTEDLVWVMGSFCALNRKPFDADLVIRQSAPPYSPTHSSRCSPWACSSRKGKGMYRKKTADVPACRSNKKRVKKRGQ
jgi:hypothetical protein